MHELSDAVSSALSQLNAAVSYAYPASFASLPVVSFLETERREQLSADDAPLIVAVQYTVDVWARTFSQAHTLGAQAEERLGALGFTLAGAQDRFDKALNACQRTLRFDAVIL